MSTKYQSGCRSIEYQSRCWWRVPIVSLDRHSIPDAFTTYDPTRARKIFEFHLAHWASYPQILRARGTSPLARVFKLINNSWTQEWKPNYRHSPLGANHFHVYAIILPYFHNFQLLHSAFYKASQFAIINMDEHSYNHIEVPVVCTLHCQILHHDYQLSQYNVIELFCLTAFRCLMAP